MASANDNGRADEMPRSGGVLARIRAWEARAQPGPGPLKTVAPAAPAASSRSWKASATPTSRGSPSMGQEGSGTPAAFSPQARTSPAPTPGSVASSSPPSREPQLQGASDKDPPPPSVASIKRQLSAKFETQCGGTGGSSENSELMIGGTSGAAQSAHQLDGAAGTGGSTPPTGGASEVPADVYEPGMKPTWSVKSMREVMEQRQQQESMTATSSNSSQRPMLSKQPSLRNTAPPMGPPSSLLPPQRKPAAPHKAEDVHPASSSAASTPLAPSASASAADSSAAAAAAAVAAAVCTSAASAAAETSLAAPVSAAAASQSAQEGKVTTTTPPAASELPAADANVKKPAASDLDHVAPAPTLCVPVGRNLEAPLSSFPSPPASAAASPPTTLLAPCNLDVGGLPGEAPNSSFVDGESVQPDVLGSIATDATTVLVSGHPLGSTSSLRDAAIDVEAENLDIGEDDRDDCGKLDRDGLAVDVKAELASSVPGRGGNRDGQEVVKLDSSNSCDEHSQKLKAQASATEEVQEKEEAVLDDIAISSNNAGKDACSTTVAGAVEVSACADEEDKLQPEIKSKGPEPGAIEATAEMVQKEQGDEKTEKQAECESSPDNTDTNNMGVKSVEDLGPILNIGGRPDEEEMENQGEKEKEEEKKEKEKEKEEEKEKEKKTDRDMTEQASKSSSIAPAAPVSRNPEASPASSCKSSRSSITDPKNLEKLAFFEPQKSTQFQSGMSPRLSRASNAVTPQRSLIRNNSAPMGELLEAPMDHSLSIVDDDDVLDRRLRRMSGVGLKASPERMGVSNSINAKTGPSEARKAKLAALRHGICTGKPHLELSNSSEQRILAAGIKRLEKELTARRDDITKLPTRKNGSQLIMTPSFFLRLLTKEFELKSCAPADVSASQRDLRYLDCDQLLCIRAGTLDFVTESGSHSAHSNFLLSLDSHLFGKLAQRCITSPQPVPNASEQAFRSLSHQLVLIVGAAVTITAEEAKRAADSGKKATPIPDCWAILLDPEMWPLVCDTSAATASGTGAAASSTASSFPGASAPPSASATAAVGAGTAGQSSGSTESATKACSGSGYRAAVFHNDRLEVELLAGEKPDFAGACAGKDVAVVQARADVMGKDKRLSWKVVIHKSTETDIMSELEFAAEGEDKQKNQLSEELGSALKMRLVHRSTESQVLAQERQRAAARDAQVSASFAAAAAGAAAKWSTARKKATTG